MNLTLVDPPVAGSLEEAEDLKKVIQQYHSRVVPERLQDRCDRDMDGMMVEFCANRGAFINQMNLKKVMLSTVPLIQKIKHHYMRPRPGTVAKRLGVEFEADFLESAQTPSYPSGHTIQAYVCAEYCAIIHPEHRDGLLMIAELVGQSRVDRGVHFQSDVDYGKLIAYEIIDHVFGAFGGQ